MVLPMNISSFLMAVIFAFSASVQFNDPDWYFWIPLYTCGCLVNLMSCCCPSRFSPSTILVMGKLILWLGSFLFVKLILFAEKEKGFDFVLWSSFDMRDRVVREKMGIGLVIVSMVFQLVAASAALTSKESAAEKIMLQIQTHMDYGIRVVLAVVITCGFSFVSLVLVFCSMIMHSASSTVLEEPHAPWLEKLAKFVDYGTLFLICLCYVLFYVICVVFVVSMVLSSTATISPYQTMGENDSNKNSNEDIMMRKKLKAHAAYGMTVLTGISFGLSGIFLVYHKDEMKL